MENEIWSFIAFMMIITGFIMASLFIMQQLFRSYMESPISDPEISIWGKKNWLHYEGTYGGIHYFRDIHPKYYVVNKVCYKLESPNGETFKIRKYESRQTAEMNLWFFRFTKQYEEET